MEGFLRQSRISRRNIKRLGELAAVPDVRIAAVATLVRDIAVIWPSRRRRLSTIRSRHPELWSRMVAIGLVRELEDPFGSDGSIPEDFIDLEPTDE